VAKRKLYYVEKIELFMIGGRRYNYLIKAKNESSALTKIGIPNKTDESFGIIKELKDNILDEANLIKGALLAEIEE